MLGFSGSTPTYGLCRLWLSVVKPNVYRVFYFSFPSSPALLPQGEKGAMPLPSSDYASLIEPTWLPPRLFAPSRQGPLDCPSPCQGGGGEGVMAPSINRHGTSRPSPCKGEGAKQRVHRLLGRVASLEPSSCLQGR